MNARADNPRPARRRLVAALAAAAALASASPARAETTEPPDYLTDAPSGHRYRVRFDPGSRIWLGFSGVTTRGRSGAVTGAPELDAGLAFRTLHDSGAGHERVTWQVDHRVLAGWVQPLRGVAGPPPLDATVYGLSMLRHDESPSIVMPTSPPVGIPFPFDVGFETDIGRVTIPAYMPPVPGSDASSRAHLGVIRAALVLDPWRSGRPGTSFEIGIGARYDLDVGLTPNAATRPLTHRVAPGTASSLRFRIQSDDGLGVIDWRGDAIPHLSSEGGWRFMALSAVHVERTLIAINDQPFAAVLEGGYRYTPSQGAEAGSDFRVSLGVAMNIQLRSGRTSP